MEPWRCLRERPGPAGHVTVVTRDYRLPDGRELEWDIVTGGQSVAVLALAPDRDVVLVRQYRPGPAHVLDELPGGGVDDGESPLQAAGRELAEETGYAGRIEIVGASWLAGNATNRRWAAVATDCEQVAQPTPDAGEMCEPLTMSLEDFRAHLRSGQLTDVDIGYLGLDHLGLLSAVQGTPRDVRGA